MSSLWTNQNENIGSLCKNNINNNTVYKLNDLLYKKWSMLFVETDLR